MNLMIRSIGIKHAEATIVIATIVYNLGRCRWWHGRTAFAGRKVVPYLAETATKVTGTERKHQ